MASPVGSTAPSHSSVRNPYIQTHSPETRLSIPPNRLVTGIARLRSVSEALFRCNVKTPTLTCAWRHRRKNFYTLFIRDATNNWLRVFFSLCVVAKRKEWEVAGRSADLNLQGCAVIGRGESGQLYYTCPLSIHNMTSAGEWIQSEALNVDRYSHFGVPLTWEAVEQLPANVVCSCNFFLPQNTLSICSQWRCL